MIALLGCSLPGSDEPSDADSSVGGSVPFVRMARDPFEVLGVARDATLAEVREAYRRTAELFHPDRVQDLRDSVRAEAERRMAEANQAMRAVQHSFGRPLRPAGRAPAKQPEHGPSDEATEAEARLYDAQLRELDRDGAYVPGSKVTFDGVPARVVLTHLRHGFKRDEGPIRMLDWGSYSIELTGDAMRTLLTQLFGAEVAAPEPASPAIGDRLPVVVRPGALPVKLVDAVVHLRTHTTYSLTADVY